jgi:glutamyl-tRNA synthetase
VSKSVVTRFAPSPTGRLHLGNIRTALINLVFARQHNGRFLLRMEDTDKERSSEEYLRMILSDLSWLGFSWDGEVVRQSERLERYREQAQKLIEEGRAYPCFCTPEELKAQREEQIRRGEPPGYDGRCGRLTSSEANARISKGEPFVVRFRLGEGEVGFRDLLRGELSFSLPEKGDFVILREDGSPTYHLAVVVDDGDLGVTHVIRGDDHLSNTPRQVRLLQALGYPVPLYCHLPLVREGKECVMEKRGGESPFSVERLRCLGFLPQALLDAVALLGWNTTLSPPIGLERLIEEFSVSQLGTSSPILTMEHLFAVNRAWIATADAQILLEEMEGLEDIPKKRLELLIEVARENSRTLRELEDWIEAIEFGPDVPVEIDQHQKRLLSFVLDLWRGSVSLADLREAMKAQGLKAKEVMPLVRLALVGESHGPPLDKILSLLPPREVVDRLEKAVASP